MVAVVLVLGVLATTSSAYVIDGNPWPGPTITYHTRPAKYAAAVDRAAAKWNHADVGIKFQATSEEAAQVVVRNGGASCTGWAIVGYASNAAMRLGKGCNTDHIVLVAVHELGHVLGLGHELNKCARMNPTIDHATGTPDRCASHPQSYWLKHALRADDVNGARALYGSR